MGLRSAAYVAQRITNAVVHIHKSMQYWSINYLDDFGSAEPEEKAWNSFYTMRTIMESIGVDEAKDKAVPPTTRMEFLGNTVDSIKMTIEVSPQRKQELLKLIQEWLEKTTHYSKKELQSLIGKLSFVTNCVQAGRIFLSRLLNELRNMDSISMVDNELRKDLKWWKHFLPEFDGISILWLQDSMMVDEYLASDACLTGGGAIHCKDFFHFKFTNEILQQTHTIVQLELFTIVIALKKWSIELQGKVIHFSTDNEVSKFAINSGRLRDEFTLRCLREIAWLSAKNEFLLRAQYIRSSDNEIPDSLSRWYKSSEQRRRFRRLTDRSWKRRSVTINDQKFMADW